MAFLATTEHGTVDDTAADFNGGFLHVGPGVEGCTRVALACAEEVAGDRMLPYLTQGTRHTQSTTFHGDGSAIGTQHVGSLAATIHAGEDVASGDAHLCLAFHDTGVGIPVGFILVRGRVIGHVGDRAGTTAEHVAEPGLAVGRRSAFFLDQHRVVGIVSRDGLARNGICISLTVIPVVTFKQGVCRSDILDITCEVRERVDELVALAAINIPVFFIVVLFVVADADLAAFDGDRSVAQQVAVHTTAINGAFHQGFADDRGAIHLLADGDRGAAYGSHKVKKRDVGMALGTVTIDRGEAGGIGCPAFAAAENMAYVAVMFRSKVSCTIGDFIAHPLCFSTDDAAVDGDFGQAGG